MSSLVCDARDLDLGGGGLGVTLEFYPREMRYHLKALSNPDCLMNQAGQILEVVS